ncbi:hypothetical protein CSA37_09270 [Candidatus Fermentibacteria bacterium]|nr:MAG: hypothetical protein CSA37_09270 [Candidatus Fermentibacteria bacterium]
MFPVREVFMLSALIMAVLCSGVIFQDDFNDGNAEGWHEVGPSNFQVSDGWYHFWGGGAVNDATSFRADQGETMSTENYVITHDVKIDVGTFGGCMVRYREEGEYNIMLVLGLPQQKLLLYRWYWNSIELVDSQPFQVEENVSYTVCFQCSGETFSGKAWETGSPEPGQWMVTAQDTLSASGAAALFTAGVFSKDTDVSMSCYFDNVTVEDAEPSEFSQRTWAGIKLNLQLSTPLQKGRQQRLPD